VSFLLVNALTLARLAAGLAFPWVSTAWRPALVLTAALTDLVDGAISRQLNASSALGRLLDPIADKTFVLVMVGTLWFEGTLRGWHIVLVGLRDWVVLGIGLWFLLARDREALLRMAPSWLGKAATAGQFSFLVSLLFFPSWTSDLFWIAAVLSGAAAADYLRRLRAALRQRAAAA
jgi:phosphatidylglycerophosphate synthase